jgi:hypothetical protein
MRTKNFTSIFFIALVFSVTVSFSVSAQVKIPSTNWTAYAYRYDANGAPSLAIDNDVKTAWQLHGSSKTGRWFMINLGDSYPVTKVTLNYDGTGANFPAGLDIYVTNDEYPIKAAEEPGDENSGDMFDKSGKTPAGSITDNTNPLIEISFPKTEGQYIWIVSNTDKAAWWICHEISVYQSSENGTTGLNPIETGFSVYPNPLPAKSQLKVNCVNDCKGKLVINDMTGKVVYQTDKLKLGINTLNVDLAKGMYILSVDESQTKLIVN